MQEIGQKWNEFIEEVLENGDSLLKNPVMYAMALLLGIIFFSLYNIPQDKKKMKYSVIGVFDYLYKILLGFLGDILAAIESITSFIDVIRIILMGKLTEGTQFLLNNYAIIALSVASFSTTFSGLSKIVPWYMAALITFGVQVGILALSSKIALEWGKRKKQKLKLRKEIYYSHEGSSLEEKEKNERKIYKKNQKQWQSNIGNEQEDDGQGDAGVQSKRYIVCHSILLLFTMCVSIYFSYVFFFGAVVLPGAPLDNYIITINMAQEVTEDYSERLSGYQKVLMGELQKFNSEIRTQLAPEMDIILTYANSKKELESKRAQLKEDYEQKKSEISENESLMEKAEDEGNEEKIRDGVAINKRLNIEKEEIGKNIKEVSDNLDDIVSNEELTFKIEIYEAVNMLDQFYAKPLIINTKDIKEQAGEIEEETGEVSIEEKEADSTEEVQKAFSKLLAYKITVEQEKELSAEENMSIVGKRDVEDWSLIFNNYLELCVYYTEHGKVGLDNTVMLNALKNEKDTLERYNAVLEEERNKERLKEGTGNKEERKTEANTILNRESADILQQLMVELNNVPIPKQWNEMDEDARRAIQNLNKSKTVSKIYDLYRVTTGMVNILEFVLLKFSMKYILLSILLIVLAVFVDTLIVILTLTKGVNNYANRLPRYRKLIYKMFIQEDISETQKISVRRRQFVGGVGIAIGLLVFGGYYISNEGEFEAKRLLITMICSVSFFSLLARILLYCLEISLDKIVQWRREGAYIRLKEVWGLPNQDKTDLDSIRGQLEKTVKNNSQLILEPEESKLISELFLDAEYSEYVKALKPEARILFRHITVFDLTRGTFEYQYANPGVSSLKEYYQGWLDKIDCPCVSVSEVKKLGLALAFAVLRAEGLVDYVKLGGKDKEKTENISQIEDKEKTEDVPQIEDKEKTENHDQVVDEEKDHPKLDNKGKTEDQSEQEEQKYYILSRKFLQVLYDLMIDTVSGTQLFEDPTLMDSLTDVYEENDLNDD